MKENMLNETTNFKKQLIASNISCYESGSEMIFKHCPYCPDDKNDLSNQSKLYANLAKGTFYCHRCEEKGTITKLQNDLFGKQLSSKYSENDTNEMYDSKTLHLQKQFNESLPLTSDLANLARTYFDNRGLMVPDSSDIRYNSKLDYYDSDGNFKGKFPAIISRLKDMDGNHVCNHTIYLDNQGNKTSFNPAKKLHGKAKGSSLILNGLSKDEIAVVEGLETGLAVYQATGLTTYVCFSANGVKDFPCPAHALKLHIFADQDASRTGERVAKLLAKREFSKKREVFIHLPDKNWLNGTKSIDFLDLLNKNYDINNYLKDTPAFNPKVDDWPVPINKLAITGIIKKFLNLIMPSTEADQNAVIIQLLVFFGNYLGRTVKVVNGPIEQYANLFTVIVGETSKGRKGTGLAEIKRLVKTSMENYYNDCFISGATSGEGIIFHVRDEVREKEEDSKTGEVVEVIKDRGVADKRKIFCESEFQQVLSAAGRNGNNLSSTLRSAWDGEPLETASKSNPCKSISHSISMVGQITKEELRHSFTSNDMSNGFANRILWALSKRSKMIANPEAINKVELELIGSELLQLACFAMQTKEIHFSNDSRLVWESMYLELDNQLTEGAYGKVISRNIPLVYRLSLIYAVLDQSKTVEPRHLYSAKAVWDYCLNSAFFIFGDLEGTPVQRKILTALSDAENGLTKSQIMDVFGRHKSSTNIDYELDELRNRGLIDSTVETTGGRNATRWFML